MEEVTYRRKKERYRTEKKQYPGEGLRRGTSIGEPEQRQIFNAFLADFNPVRKNSEQVVEVDEQGVKTLEKGLNKSSTLLVASGFGSVKLGPTSFIAFPTKIKIAQKTEKKGRYHGEQDWKRKRSPSVRMLLLPLLLLACRSNARQRENGADVEVRVYQPTMSLANMVVGDIISGKCVNLV